MYVLLKKEKENKKRGVGGLWMSAAFMYVMAMCLTPCQFVWEIAANAYVRVHKSVSVSVSVCTG